MRITLYILALFFLTSCTNNPSKSVFWCGDHECVNKKEKDAYFEKTLTVEKRLINKKTKKNFTEIEKIKKQIKLDEKKKLSKEKNAKKLAKIKKKNDAREKKELKKIAKRKSDKSKNKESFFKKQSKDQIKQLNKSKTNEVEQFNKDIASLNINTKKLPSFNEFVTYIKNRNNSRSFPDINDIPE